MTPDERPYADAARAYLSRGWSPIPLPAGQKYPPPKGWTGYDAPYPSAADVEEWALNGRGAGNIGLRLGEDVIGIDVDRYGSKRGGETIAEAEARLGKLPPTWRSSARSEPGSGIFFYRVPAGRAWADGVGADVELIHHGHRYAVVAPSVHPGTGTPYRWFHPVTGLPGAGPSVAELPRLAGPWVADLDRGPASEVSRKAHLEEHEVHEAVAAFPEGPPCPVVAKALDESRPLLQRGSRHDAGRERVLVLVRHGEQGHRGAREALADLRGMWLAALEHGERRQPDHGEWERMVAGAVAITAEKPTPGADRGCCGDDSFPVFDPGADGFWSRRPVLAHIHRAAQAGRTSPWAALGCVLARVVAATHYSVVLPSLVGGHGSLNFFVALVGESGMGKGAAEAVARKCVPVGHVTTATVGSGEGIAHLYAKRVKGEVERVRDAVLFSVPEVDNLAALGGRQGSTLLSQLRVAWSGEQLGFAYADPAKALPVEAQTYRMGLVLGVQPGRAGALLDDSDGGTPQRFVWFLTSDRTAPEVPPDDPGPWQWPGVPHLFANEGKFVVVDVCAEALATIDAERTARLHEEGDALDAHSMLARLKTAAALGLLDGRLEVSPEDWDLAGQVMRVSSATRARCQQVLAQKATLSNKGRAEVKALEAIVVEERVAEAAVSRVSRRMLAALARRGETTSRELRDVLAGRDRKHFAAAVEHLVAGGLATVSDEGARTVYRAVK